MSNCTVVVRASGTLAESRCGAPAVASFTGRNGDTLYECIDHAVLSTTPEHAAVPATRSTRPFLLVRDGAVVGYAESNGFAVARRARRLGATIMANV